MDDVSIIDAQNIKFVELYNGGDVESLIKIFSESAMVMLANSDIIVGRQNILGAFKFMKRKIATIKNSTLELSVYGDVAIEVGLYEHFDSESNSVDAGKFLVVWRRFDGEWLIDKDSLNTSKR